MTRSFSSTHRARMALFCGGVALTLASTGSPASGQARRAANDLADRISIVIDVGRAVTPAEARAPAVLLDSGGRILIVDQLQGFLVGRFTVPPGLRPASGQLGGVRLDASAPEGPPIPDVPLTTFDEVLGFPFVTKETPAGGLGLADFDHEGILEIVVATTGGTVYRITPDGGVAPGWPLHVSDAFHAPPAIGDIDGDSTPEIVIGSAEGVVHAWDAGGQELPGWPVALRYEGFPTGSIFGAAALEDLNGDGAREVCVGTSTGLIAVLDGKGHFWPGWPQVLPPSTHPPNPAGIFASPALADLDGNRFPEVIVATNAGVLYAWDGTGRAMRGWPVELPYNARAGYGGVAVGDVNGDELPEVIVTTERGIDGPPIVIVFDGNGALQPGWPFPLAESCNAGVALGDLTGDGVAEIVVATIGGDAFIYALDGRTAEPVTGWPLRLRDRTINASPILADADGDGHIDILVAALSTSIDARGWLWAFDRLTDPLRGFPILIPDDEIVRAAPAIADIDNDGSLELLAATELRNALHMWDLNAICEPELLPWSMLAGGPARTGVLMGERVWRSSPMRSAEAGAGANMDGRDSPLMTIDFELDEGSNVGLAIFDIKGRPVRQLLDYELPPGHYSIRWDGRDDQGHTRASGIYFYQLSLNKRATTRQLLLLR
jgi:hypothetical protein